MSNPRKAFSKIYDKYIVQIYRFIFFKVNSREVAEDLCSETFLRGWNVFKEKQAEIKNMAGFLFRTAKNLVIDYYRQKARTGTIPIENIQLIDQRVDLEKQIILTSDTEQVKQALAGLKDDYQNVIIWHYLDDLPVSQVAELLGRTEGTTRVLLHRALNELKKKLNDDLRG